MKEKILQNIKTIRESKNFTESFVAKGLNIHQSTYSKKENGETEFTLTEFLKIGEVMEVPVVKFIELDFGKIIHQQNNDSSTGNVIDHQHLADYTGYKLCIEQNKEEIDFLKNQNKTLIDLLAKK
jgi:transcriptional regulator with XRE-family HTH domain